MVVAFFWWICGQNKYIRHVIVCPISRVFNGGINVLVPHTVIGQSLITHDLVFSYQSSLIWQGMLILKWWHSRAFHSHHNDIYMYYIFHDPVIQNSGHGQSRPPPHSQSMATCSPANPPFKCIAPYLHLPVIAIKCVVQFNCLSSLVWLGYVKDRKQCPCLHK